jgi:hypothetical protein
MAKPPPPGYERHSLDYLRSDEERRQQEQEAENERKAKETRK